MLNRDNLLIRSQLGPFVTTYFTVVGDNLGGIFRLTLHKINGSFLRNSQNRIRLYLS